VLPIGAGAEVSVAATKTFVATLSAILRLTAAWSDNFALRARSNTCRSVWARASALDWSASFGAFAAATSMMTIGRGPTLAIAGEAALKLKETCLLHAEAFSGSEFLHGSRRAGREELSHPDVHAGGPAADALRELEADLRRKGAAVFATAPGKASDGHLPHCANDHPETDAICLIQSFLRHGGASGEIARQRRGEAPGISRK